MSDGVQYGPTARWFMRQWPTTGPVRNASLIARDDFGRVVCELPVMVDGAAVAPFDGSGVPVDLDLPEVSGRSARPDLHDHHGVERYGTGRLP